MQDKTRNSIFITLGVGAVLALLIWAAVGKIQNSAKNLGEEFAMEMEEEEAESGHEAEQGSRKLKALQIQLDHIRGVSKRLGTTECDNLTATIDAYAQEHRAELIEAKMIAQNEDGKTPKASHVLKMALMVARMGSEMIKLNTETASRCPKEANTIENALVRMLDPKQVD
ncbi:MAG: hypothetical protein JRF33_19320 [Deltaproteobacteria bacterium]|nr:hypothetical protein [Deltaproteobacteria bacterium]